uniref:Uncharacterized protein n=1 Tax=Romanomermis culicivorax TaxID=13658 RepID=A0A915INL5_ROMCU
MIQYMRPFILFASNRFRKQLNRVVFYLHANALSNFVLSTSKRPSTIRCIIVAVSPAPRFCYSRSGRNVHWV